LSDVDVSSNIKTTGMKILTRMALALTATPCLLWLVPAPLSGYWHTPLTDCLCDSNNLLSFQDGKAYEWASGHGIVKEENGTYRRGIYWAEWKTTKKSTLAKTFQVRPGWFFIRIKMARDPNYPSWETFWGYRELRPSFINEVLATKQRTPRPAGATHGSQPIRPPTNSTPSTTVSNR